MYISEILQYLLWPLLIAVSWFAIHFAIKQYEKKYPAKEEQAE